MLRRLHEHGCADFDAAYLPVFGYPGPQGLRPSELAARLGMSKQALNYLLGSLERAGYLEREPHPDDARSRLIALTPRGVRAVTVIRDAVAEVETSWTQLLGARRFAQLRKMLEELGRSSARAIPRQPASATRSDADSASSPGSKQARQRAS
jgi:DNA-binding MarR family transcriptional regulator